MEYVCNVASDKEEPLAPPAMNFDKDKKSDKEKNNDDDSPLAPPAMNFDRNNWYENRN